jgi:hypothetical protein
MAKKGKLLFKLILILVIAGAFIATHEQVHVLVFSVYNIDAEIHWLELPPRTVPNQAQLSQLTQSQAEMLQFLQAGLEIATYGPLIMLILWILLRKG